MWKQTESVQNLITEEQVCTHVQEVVLKVAGRAPTVEIPSADLMQASTVVSEISGDARNELLSMQLPTLSRCAV